MSSSKEQTAERTPTIWTGCYEGGWKSLIVDDAFR
jgi:hypothetical protein